MNQSFEAQPTYYLQSSSASENTEGGLNIEEVTSTVIRKLPLVAFCTLAMTSAAFFKTLIFPPVYVSNVELLSESVNIETKVTSTNDRSEDTREKINKVELDDVQLRILKSPVIISRVVESLQDKYPELTYTLLTKDLDIEFIRDEQNKKNVLSVTYEHSDKQQVADVIEVLTQTYLDYSTEKRLSGVERGITFLERQIPQVSAQVDSLENQLEDLRNKYNFIAPEVSLEPITERSSILSQQEDEIASQLQQLRLKLRNLERELATQPTRSPTAMELATPRYLSLLEQLKEVDVRISQKSSIYSDRTAQMQILQEEKQRVIALLTQAGRAISQQLRNEISTLENRQRIANSESANLQSQLQSWSTVSNKYKNLQQQLESAKSKLEEFTFQKNALLIDAAKQETPWQLLAPPTKPYSNELSASNRLLLGSTFGLLLGVGLALILDKHQKILYTSAKVEEITSLPILGRIPYAPKGQQLLLPDRLKSGFKMKQLPSSDLYLEEGQMPFPEFFPASIEAFRSFAANLGLLNFNTEADVLRFDNSLKSIAITSAIAGEGKSTVALNLARASASIGKRVLLVDADVRSKVCLTDSLGLETEIGLKNILSQDNSSIALKHIKQSPLEESLFILSSGFSELTSNPKTSDSSRMLASTNMCHLMEELKAHFDLVIYDLCAVVGYADVNLVAGRTDGIIMVTGLGKVDKQVLSQALNQLKMCNVPILGIATNQIVNKS
jgi:capsular exopolysaccharide synthesis family protein